MNVTFYVLLHRNTVTDGQTDNA